MPLGKAHVWLRLDSTGQASMMPADRHMLINKYGVRHRDLRLLDPNSLTPPPSALFIREKALVLSLEAIRLVITKDQVFVMSVPESPDSLHNPTAPHVDNYFVQDLSYHLRAADTGIQDLLGPIDADKRLPYELRAVEAGLASFTRAFEAEATRVEKRLQPALDEIHYHVSRGILGSLRENRRVLKRMVKRLVPFRNALDDIVDDDDELRDLYLNRMELYRASEQQSIKEEMEEGSPEPAGRAPLAAPQDSDPLGGGPEAPEGHGEAPADEEAGRRTDDEDLRSPMGSSSDLLQHQRTGETSRLAEGMVRGGDDLAEPLGEDALFPPNPVGPTEGPGKKSHRVRLSGKKKNKDKKHKQKRWRDAQTWQVYDVEDCEDLLEAYITQLNHLIVRLTNLEDDIRSSEAQLMVELDQRRNELVATELILTCVATIFTFVAMVGSVFGMNLNSTLQQSVEWFWSVTGVSLAVGALMFGAFVWYTRRKRLLFVQRPEPLEL